MQLCRCVCSTSHPPIKAVVTFCLSESMQPEAPSNMIAASAERSKLAITAIQHFVKIGIAATPQVMRDIGHAQAWLA